MTEEEVATKQYFDALAAELRAEMELHTSTNRGSRREAKQALKHASNTARAAYAHLCQIAGRG